MHDVALRRAAVLQQGAGGQDAQQAASLAEGCAGHAQQLRRCTPLEGAWEEGQQQQVCRNSSGSVLTMYRIHLCQNRPF